jgi:hypothetical protein
MLMNRIFNWHALGVPLNQMNCFLKDGTIEDFVKATFDPVPTMTTLKVCLCLSCLTTAFCLLPLPLHFFSPFCPSHSSLQSGLLSEGRRVFV